MDERPNENRVWLPCIATVQDRHFIDAEIISPVKKRARLPASMAKARLWSSLLGRSRGCENVTTVPTEPTMPAHYPSPSKAHLLRTPSTEGVLMPRCSGHLGRSEIEGMERSAAVTLVSDHPLRRNRHPPQRYVECLIGSRRPTLPASSCQRDFNACARRLHLCPIPILQLTLARVSVRNRWRARADSRRSRSCAKSGRRPTQRADCTEIRP